MKKRENFKAIENKKTNTLDFHFNMNKLETF